MRTAMITVLVLLPLYPAISTAQEREKPPQAQPAETKVQKQVARRQISQWAKELDSDRFLTREQATEKLIDVGAPAVDKVVEAMSNGNREIITRGFHILQKVALSGDRKNEKAARAALEVLSKPQTTFVAHRAKTTLIALNKIRQERVLKHLKQLGANTQQGYRIVGTQRVEVSSLFIGDEWGAHENNGREGLIKISRNNWQGTLEDLQQLKYLVDVDYIFFSGKQVTDDWVKAIGEMDNLSYVIIKRAPLSDAAISHLRSVKKLRYLELRYVPISDNAVEGIAAFPIAQDVELCGTNITEKGIERLRAASPHMKVTYRKGGYLGIRLGDHALGSLISSVMPGSAAAAANLNDGDVLFRFGGKQSESASVLIDLISKYRSKDKVEVDLVRGGYLFSRTFTPSKEEKLGIEGKNTILGCHITKVAASSLASRLQLEPGDYIVSHGGRKFPDLKTLENLHATKAAAEVAQFEILRGAQLLKKTVFLGEWD